ncbi:hypothetical protein D3C71_1958660 [compost metagenome]
MLAWTAAKMLVDEPLISGWFVSGAIKYGFEIIMVAVVVGLGTWAKRRHERQRAIRNVLNG